MPMKHDQEEREQNPNAGTAASPSVAWFLRYRQFVQLSSSVWLDLRSITYCTVHVQFSLTELIPG